MPNSGSCTGKRAASAAARVRALTSAAFAEDSVLGFFFLGAVSAAPRPRPRPRPAMAASRPPGGAAPPAGPEDRRAAARDGRQQAARHGVALPLPLPGFGGRAGSSPPCSEKRRFEDQPVCERVASMASRWIRSARRNCLSD